MNDVLNLDLSMRISANYYTKVVYPNRNIQMQYQKVRFIKYTVFKNLYKPFFKC